MTCTISARCSITRGRCHSLAGSASVRALSEVGIFPFDGVASLHRPGAAALELLCSAAVTPLGQRRVGQLLVAAVFISILLLGFMLGYGVRASISHRRRLAAYRSRHSTSPSMQYEPCLQSKRYEASPVPGDVSLIFEDREPSVSLRHELAQGEAD